MRDFSHFGAARVALMALAALGLGAAAHAQSINANSAAYNAGYGRFSGEENQPVSVGVRDANGNLLIVDGMIESGETGAFASAQASGAIDTFAGVGASGGSTAIANNLNVVTQGSDNTVIVSSSQTNTGNVSASTH